MIISIVKNGYAIEVVLAAGADFIPVAASFTHQGDLIALVENQSMDEVASYFANGSGSCRNLADFIGEYDGEFLADLAAVQAAARAMGKRPEKSLRWNLYKQRFPSENNLKNPSP